MPMRVEIPRGWLRRATGEESTHQGVFERPARDGIAGLGLGGVPDGQTEPDLVHEVCKVVDQVQWRIRDLSSQVTEEISERVDGPSNGDDKTHGSEGRADGIGDFGGLGSNTGTLTSENLKQNEAPSAHADDEAH